MGRFTKYNANLTLLVSDPVPAFRCVSEPISLSIVDGNSCYLVNNDIPAVIQFGNPVFTILIFLHFYSLYKFCQLH